MTQHHDTLIHRLLLWWDRQVVRFPWTLLILTTTLCGFSLHYTINNLGFNTDTTQMLSPDLPFQVNRFRLNNAFPEDAAAIMLVVDGETPEQISRAAAELAQRLSRDKEHFESAIIPTDNAFFKQQALLFLSLDELDDLSKKLTDAQPFIGYLAQHYNLEGLFEIIRQALEEKNKSLPMNLTPLLTAIDDTVDRRLNRNPRYLSWQNLLADHRLNTESKRSIVIAKPKLIFTDIMPADFALSVARSVSQSIMQENPAVRIRITGETALQHEELETVSEGAIVSGILSLLLVCASLWLSYRSVRLLLTTLAALIMGLILTAGFATLAVGHLNIISVAFAVLYIGLGVDYATHLCLRYRECRAAGMNNESAITESINSIGFSLFLCALTTAIGFLGFIPTDYSGVSELGIISSAGMFIGLGLSLSIVPALLKVMPLGKTAPFRSSQLSSAIAHFPFRHAKAIRTVSILLAIASAAILTQLEFDSSTFNLRDPSRESASTFKELLSSRNESPYSLTGLADSLAEADRRAEALRALPTTHEALTLSSFVAGDQEDKLYRIEELDMILGAQLKQFGKPLLANDQRDAAIRFAVTLQKAIDEATTAVPIPILKTLLARINSYIEFADRQPEPNAEYSQLEQNILGLLPYTMQRLSISLTAQAYDLNDLPPYITDHWQSKTGLYKIMITPEKNLNIVSHREAFVNDVQSIDTTVSGLPIIDKASGDAIILSFVEAFACAFAAIVMLMLIITKNIRDTLLMIGSLLLATLLTGATNVLLNNPFNFANIIALPLLMGMGVDSGIHVVHRLNSHWSNGVDLLQSSTARGVLFSSLTTLCSFSSLAFTPHPGTSSMGLLLAIGISFTIICTLIVLPAFSRHKI
ncbi:MMPL family transporter [Methylotuvimicrobium sp. KM2]|uniref:MMPL family transporter n=1 Tax=Methylotuvimicrobium sp. KM2 TaxID=3133976 RepID=UPI003100CC46